jgi:hypothetical protein
VGRECVRCDGCYLFSSPLEASYLAHQRAHAVAPTVNEGPMHYYIPQMLPEYVEVEPHVFQPYCDATVAGWRNEQRLATRQGKHQRPGVAQMVLLADKLRIAESVPLHPYLVKLGDLEKFRFLLDR